MAVGFKTYGHEDKFWNLGPMPNAEWVNFFKDATLFSSRLTGQAEESGIPGAPPLGAFEERAANART